MSLTSNDIVAVNKLLTENLPTETRDALVAMFLLMESCDKRMLF